MKELIDRGFDVNLKDHNGTTPRDLGQSANDRIKEHLGLVHTAVESESDAPKSTESSDEPALPPSEAISEQVQLPSDPDGVKNPTKQDGLAPPKPLVDPDVSPVSPAEPAVTPLFPSSFHPTPTPPIASPTRPLSTQLFPPAPVTVTPRPASMQLPPFSISRKSSLDASNEPALPQSAIAPSEHVRVIQPVPTVQPVQTVQTVQPVPTTGDVSPVANEVVERTPSVEVSTEQSRVAGRR